MDLVTATQKVKNALSSKDYIGSLTHYHLKNSRVYATDGNLTASAPIDEPLEYVVPAEEFDKIQDIFGTDVNYTWSPESLIVKKGRKRMAIRLLAPDQVSLQEPTRQRQKLPLNFFNSIKKIRPFISDDASRPWALTAWLRNNVKGHPILIATNNICVVEVDIGYPEIAESLGDVQIPNLLLDFLLQRENTPKEIGIETNKVSFFYEDGSEVTSQLFSTKMPDMVYNILNEPEKTGTTEYFQLTEEWKDAYKSIINLSPEEVMFSCSVMSAGKKQAQIEIDVVTTPPRDTTKLASYYNPKFLTPVVDIATHIDFGNYPKSSAFFGPGVRGLIVGKVV